MNLHITNPRRTLRIAFFLCFIFLTGMGLGWLYSSFFSENASFEKFADELFQKEVTGNTLTLHYCLAHPENWNIHTETPSLGRISTDFNEYYTLCQDYEKQLKNFSYSELSRENQLTLDLLLLYYHNQLSLGNNYLLEEYLSPSLGIQAQLPVLLAEYTFYDKEDIGEYFTLLSDIRPYFESILTFEQEKSKAGFFMSDTTLDRILEQCYAFIQNPNANYMQEIFKEKISEFPSFSEKNRQELLNLHQKLLVKEVIPAYQELIRGLEALRGTGTNDGGLANFSGGKNYYLYLIRSEVGSYLSISQIQKLLYERLLQDLQEVSEILKKEPTILSRQNIFPQMKPETILHILQQQIQTDFPNLCDTSYEIRKVHASMEEYLSPAFYLTPPLDTGSPNTIYINQFSQHSSLEQFTTLAHEGFPGHLYQTVYFTQQNPLPIRYLLSSTGYVEGWATYIESYASLYATQIEPALSDANKKAIQLSQRNRTINLCLSSLLDIGIHYYGWNVKQASDFLKNFGITDANTITEIYQYIVETPANYLNYCLGAISLEELKKKQQQKLGEHFSLKQFHEDILKIGPVPFPLLEKYLN